MDFRIQPLHLVDAASTMVPQDSMYIEQVQAAVGIRGEPQPLHPASQSAGRLAPWRIHFRSDIPMQMRKGSESTGMQMNGGGSKGGLTWL